jgi:hypothetical protein
LGEVVGSFTPTLWHHNGVVWNKQTGTTTNTATSLTYTGYTGSFSPFAIIDPLYILPVVFNGFNIQKVGKTSLIKWNTSQEQNSKDFVIQHSLNGNDWTNIATLPAAGFSTSTRSYNYVHSTPAPGKNLYRIMQRDLDGKLTYTTILTISFGQEGNLFTVLSNPVQHRQLKVNVPNKGLLKLYNSQGQLLNSIPVTTGVQVIDMATIPAGLYYVEVGNQTRTIILK